MSGDMFCGRGGLQGVERSLVVEEVCRAAEVITGGRGIREGCKGSSGE